MGLMLSPSMEDFNDKSDKNRSDERVLVLEPVEGKQALSSVGIVDKRLFNGENKLTALKEQSNGLLWYLRYDHGMVPPAMQQRFTSFNKLKDWADAYFARRNMRIKEVIG